MEYQHFKKNPLELQGKTAYFTLTTSQIVRSAEYSL